MQDLYSLRYPIGEYDYSQSYSFAEAKQCISIIREFPKKLTELIGKWGDNRLDTPYRPEGWTVRQLAHHVVDSHTNAYVRTKLALTEDNPRITPYEEAEWAKLPDYQLDVAPSLVILSNLHLRWVTVLESLAETKLLRTYFHPGLQRTFPLTEMLGLYAWHCEHHYQHIYRLAERNGWLEKNV